MKDNSLPIIDIAYKLALECNRVVVRFPRHQRPGLGRRIEETSVCFLDKLTQARYLSLSCKATVLLEASHYLDTLRLLIRISSELNYLPIKKYTELSRVLTEAGRMLGGWHKSQKHNFGL